MHRAFPLKRQTVVTCIDTLNKVSIRRFTPRRVARDRRAVCRAGWALRVATIISTVIIIITIIIIGKPKSSSKSKSQIPYHISKVQRKGTGTGADTIILQATTTTTTTHT